MKLHRYVDHQRLHIVTKDVISLSISVLLLFRHYISHKITFDAPSSGGVLCSACGAFIKKFFWGISFECQTDWIHIRPNILSGLIWIQTVCKSFLQTALGGKELTQGAVLCICSHF